MDQPGIAVEREHDGLVRGENRIEIVIGQSVRMFGLRLERHQVHHVDHSNPDIRDVLAQQVDGSQRFQRRDVAAAGHDDVGFAAFVVARPIPDADSGRAMLDRRIHIQILQRGLLAGDDHVHVIPAAQAVIGHREQAVRVGRQIHAHDVRFLIDHHDR